tara:strand:+ start:3002 stop:3589 length:588 start_codon:yes stop_codon:yes gene_type:complete
LNWWGNFFGKKKSEQTDKSPYLPEKKTPKDVSFAENFTANGGFFLFSEDKKEVLINFKEILKENYWFRDDILCFDKNLSNVFDLPLSDPKIAHQPSKVGLFLCEYLISNTGSILFCDRQTHHYKITELPKVLIVYASTSQLVSDVSEGMTLLKNKYKNTIPTNISTLNSKIERNEEEIDPKLNQSKTIYLLLQDH